MNLPFHHDAHQKTFENARFLKKVLTPAEEILWKELRGRRFKGHKFRRQHPIKSFIADFYCHASQLILEIDGGYHNSETSRKYDEDRTKELNVLGIRVIRFSNDQVSNHLGKVLDEIGRNLIPDPSPMRRRE